MHYWEFLEQMFSLSAYVYTLFYEKGLRTTRNHTEYVEQRKGTPVKVFYSCSISLYRLKIITT